MLKWRKCSYKFRKIENFNRFKHFIDFSFILLSFWIFSPFFFFISFFSMDFHLFLFFHRFSIFFLVFVLFLARLCSSSHLSLFLLHLCLFLLPFICFDSFSLFISFYLFRFSQCWIFSANFIYITENAVHIHKKNAMWTHISRFPCVLGRNCLFHQRLLPKRIAIVEKKKKRSLHWALKIDEKFMEISTFWIIVTLSGKKNLVQNIWSHMKWSSFHTHWK